MTNLFCVFDSINIGKQFAATSHEKHMPMKRIQRELEFQLACLKLIQHNGVSISDFLGRNKYNVLEK